MAGAEGCKRAIYSTRTRDVLEKPILGAFFFNVFFSLSIPYRAGMWISTATFYCPTSTTCCEHRWWEKRAFDIIKRRAKRHRKQERNSILITVVSMCCNSVRQPQPQRNQRKITLKLHQIFILILLPPLSHRAPTLNQYCFFSLPTPDSIDFGKISNYLSIVLHSTREPAAVL